MPPEGPPNPESLTHPANPTILPVQAVPFARAPRVVHRAPREVAMKARLTRLVYALATLACLAAALGAGMRWH
jgi:hypothetical protein